jgi:hypothetical protein
MCNSGERQRVQEWHPMWTHCAERRVGVDILPGDYAYDGLKNGTLVCG